MDGDKKLSTQYLAGFFDGEGCVGIYQRKDCKNPSVIIQISNTNLAILEDICSIYGGHISKLKIRSINHTQAHLWRVTCSTAGKFLRDIAPFSRIKKAEIIYALSIISKTRKYIKCSV